MPLNKETKPNRNQENVILRSIHYNISRLIEISGYNFYVYYTISDTI